MTNQLACRDAYGETLIELGAINPNIVVLDADLSGSTRTAFFAKAFPERFFNMGIAEQDMIGTAAGLATVGKTVFVSTFAMFASGRPWEQIRNSVCYPNLNVKIVATHAGITVGEDGASHQALEDIAIMRAIPNMKVFVPADYYETKEIIKYIANIQGPCYVRLPRAASPVVFDENYKFDPYNYSNIGLTKGQADIAIIACGIMVDTALKAQTLLTQDSINAKVVNVSAIKPIIAKEILEICKDAKAVVTVEEHNIIGGLGSTVAEVLSKNQPKLMEFIGINDHFGESGQAEKLLKKFHLTETHIYSVCKKIIAKI